MSLAAPGWYPDPRGAGPAEPAAPGDDGPDLEAGLRWWDGTAWTSWVAPAGTREPPAGAPASRVVPDEVREDRRWHRVWATVTVLALATLALAVAGMQSQRRDPPFQFPPTGPASTAAPSLQPSDITFDDRTGVGTVAPGGRFRIPLAPFAKTTGEPMPAAVTSAWVTFAASSGRTAVADDSTLTVAMVNPDVLQDGDYRSVTPNLVRLLASSRWKGRRVEVGRVDLSDVPGLGPTHPGAQATAPVVVDGRACRVFLRVVRVRGDSWMAWWEVRQPGLPAAQAAQLDAARSGLSFDG